MLITYLIDRRIKTKLADTLLAEPKYVELTGEVTEASIKTFTTELLAADEVAQRLNQPAIPVIIDSYGGYVHSCFRAIDAIKACRTPVATVAVGKMMSAGATIFSAGTPGYRYVAKHTTAMIHEVSSFVFGKNEAIKTGADETARLNRVLLEMLSVNCGREPGYFAKLIHDKGHVDLFYNAEECVLLGLSDYIGIPELKINLNVSMSFGTR